ncbi:MAG: molybdopterin-dependent oxidoreductase, partial [Proteobacteria bacterium]|nr:molybdopterin-dependent oxidoreductase [Pseudomonadota bacterium]
EARLALDGEGRIRGLKIETIANMGAYLSNAAPIVPTYASRGIQLGAYVIRAAHVSVTGVYSNTVPVDAYRGAGRPEAIYIIERLIDAAAAALKMNPAELRRRNLVPPSAIPYDNPLGLVYDSGEFERVLAKALLVADWDGAPGRRAAALARGRLHGIGMAYYIEKSGDPAIGDETAEVNVAPNVGQGAGSGGIVRVSIGTQATGQGHETAYAQVIAENLGVPFASVEVRQGDTAAVATGGGSGGSRSLMVGGSAIKLAADDIVRQGKIAAADLLEAAVTDIEFAEGFFAVSGTDRRVGLFDLAASPQTAQSGAALTATATFAPGAPSFPNGCHICEIEIDPETGAPDVVAYTVVDDFGRIINPLLAEGQVHGGVAQGIGQALFEEAVYDDHGQLLSGSFMDYAMPRASNLLAIATEFQEVLTPNNPLGVKGAGESGAIAAPPAVMNAIADALSAYGPLAIDMPATPEKIWRAIAQGRTQD